MFPQCNQGAPSPSWPDLWLSAVLQGPAGSGRLRSYGQPEKRCSVHLAQLVSHLLGPVAWEEKNTRANMLTTFLHSSLKPKNFHRRLAGNYLERKGRDDSLSGQRRTTRGGSSRSLSEHFGGPVCYRDRTWGSLFSEISMNASKPRSIVTQPASRQFPPSSNQTTTFAPLMQKSWGQPSATGK